MRVTLLIVLLSAFFVSAFLPLVVVLGGGDSKVLQSEHTKSMLLKAKNPVERSLNQAFFWFANHRIWFAWASAVGVVFTLL